MMNINCYRDRNESLTYIENLKKNNKRFIYMIKNTNNYGSYYVVYCITNKLSNKETEHEYC